MAILFDVAVRFPDMDDPGEDGFNSDPATTQIDYIRGYVKLDCSKTVNLCNWNPQREDSTVIDTNFSDPTVITGNTINVAGDPTNCPVIVQAAQTYFPSQYLDLYASNEILIENGFVAQENCGGFVATITPCSDLVRSRLTVPKINQSMKIYF